MVRKIRPNERRLLDGSRVGCPVSRGDVDIEKCLACGKLLRIVGGDSPYVMCSEWRQDQRTAGPAR